MLGADRHAAEVAAQLIREYIYLYGAVSPKDGTCVYLIMPTSNTACFQVFLEVLARKFAGKTSCWFSTAPQPPLRRPCVPDNITLLYLPPYSPELNPKENLWDESAKNLQELRAQIHGRVASSAGILYIERIQVGPPSLSYIVKRDVSAHSCNRYGCNIWFLSCNRRGSAVPAKLARAASFLQSLETASAIMNNVRCVAIVSLPRPTLKPGVTMNDQKPPRSAQRFSLVVIMRSRHSSQDAQAKGNSRGYRRNPSSAAPRQEEERETHSRPQFEMCACTRRRTQQAGLEVNGAL